jgi:hypothetical protein
MRMGVWNQASRYQIRRLDVKLPPPDVFFSQIADIA